MSVYSDDEIVLNEKLSIKNGNYALVGISIVSNFAALFAIDALHSTSEEVAMLNALPALMSIIATWAGAVWLAKVPSKKMFCVRATFVARMFYLLIAMLPFVVHGPALALLVVLAIAVMNFPASFSALSWQSLIGDLIPENRRADFFGRRNRATTFVGMLSTLVPGLVLQRFPVSSIAPYQVFFSLGFFFSLLEVYYLFRHKERMDKRPDMAAPALFHPRQFVTFLHRAPYRMFLIGSIIFNLGWQMAWPLYSIYQIQDASATALWVSSFTVANQISQIITFKFWGRLSERYGNTMMLAIACLGMAIAPVLTILSKNLPYLIFTNLATGTFVAGITLLQFNHLLEVSPESQRTSYIAHFNIVIGLVGFVAPQVGVLLLHIFHMGLSMTLSSVVRAGGTVFFLYMFFHARRAKLQDSVITS